MNLTAQVVRIEHGTMFTDGKPRITLRIRECDSTYNDVRLRVASLDRIVLGEHIGLIMLWPDGPVESAMAMVDAAEARLTPEVKGVEVRD